jgi:MFS family permease
VDRTGRPERRHRAAGRSGAPGTLAVTSARPVWRLHVALLGVTTIGAYGLVLYGFGAFVAPMRDDTGWSNAAIAAAFSVSTLAGGLLALATGALIDRVGTRPVMGGSLLAGSGLLLLASTADDVAAFVTMWGAGGAIISAGLFYNATMAITARITPVAERPRAYTWLTVIGGLASPVAFPLAGAFIELWGWRAAIRAMVGFLVACTVPAVVLVDGRACVDDGDGERADDGYAGVGAALQSGPVRRWLLAAAAAMAGLVAIQVHHVAAIEATGVSVGLASTMAGVRGLLSLPGRAAAAAVTARIGVRGALRAAYAVMAIGTAALVAAGAIGWAWAFVVLTGVAFGSVAPLQGLYAAEIFGRRRIGTLMGMQQVVFGAASAAGPWLLGLTVDATGGYTALLLSAAALQVVALVSFREPVGARTGAVPTER